MIKLELPFCIPFMAPRKSGRRFYNPRSEEKRKAQWLIRSQYCGQKLIGAVEVIYVFEFGVPRSASKKKKEVLLNYSECLKHVDLDNMSKFLGDCLKGIIFEDDSQIVKLTVYKFWAEKDRTQIFCEQKG
jgi:Holliday junction resolvase RusA-like endonuclease